MRLPLAGLIYVFVAAGCSTQKPAQDAESTTVVTGDAPRRVESSELTPASSQDASTDNRDADDREPESSERRRTMETTAPATIGSEPQGTTQTSGTNRSEPNRNEPNAAPNDTKPDNTKVNKRDANSPAMTPVDQGENDVDLKITQQIRQAVMADSSLSFTAKNVKIITSNRKVTLRGPVKTAAERASIESAARKVAGPSMVDNQLEVAP